MCSLKTILWLNFSIFSLVALAHLTRVILQGEILIGGWNFSLWYSGLAFLITGTMVFLNLKHLQ